MSQRRDKLRTQGDMFDDNSADFMTMGALRSDRKHLKDDQGKKNTQAPNLADVEAMLQLHGASGQESGETW